MVRVVVSGHSEGETCGIIAAVRHSCLVPFQRLEAMSRWLAVCPHPPTPFVICHRRPSLLAAAASTVASPNASSGLDGVLGVVRVTMSLPLILVNVLDLSVLAGVTFLAVDETSDPFLPQLPEAGFTTAMDGTRE